MAFLAERVLVLHRAVITYASPFALRNGKWAVLAQAVFAAPESPMMPTRVGAIWKYDCCSDLKSLEPSVICDRLKNDLLQLCCKETVSY